MNRYPKISVVTPSFNQGQFLRETIESVLSQDYPNLEYMIIDGGSTDDSREIIERYESQLAYWCSEPDEGQSHGIAKGFAHANGEILCWLNSDDVLLPGTLSAVAHAYRRHPLAGIIAGNYVLISPTSKVIRFRRFGLHSGWFVRKGLTVISPNCFFASKEYQAVGGVNLHLTYVMDTDLFVRMLANGARYCHIDRYLTGFRIHPSAKTTAFPYKMQAEWNEISSKYTFNVAHGTRRRLLTLTYYLWQMINGNYMRVIHNTWRARGQCWQDTALSGKIW